MASKKENLLSKLRSQKKNAEPHLRIHDVAYYLVQIEKENYDLSPDYQREEAWTPSHRQEFIGDIIGVNENENLTNDIGALKSSEQKTGVKRIVEGKQRSETLLFFSQNKFPFKYKGLKYFYDKIPEKYVKDKNVFVLPDKFHKRFERYPITIFEYVNLTQQQERYLFETTNKGVSLNPAEKLNAIDSPLNTFLKNQVFPTFIPILENFGFKTFRYNCRFICAKMMYVAFHDFDIDKFKELTFTSIQFWIKRDDVVITKDMTTYYLNFLQSMDPFSIDWRNSTKKLSQEMFFDMLFIYEAYKEHPNRQNIMKQCYEFIKMAKLSKHSDLTSLQQEWMGHISGSQLNPTNLRRRTECIKKYISQKERESLKRKKKNQQNPKEKKKKQNQSTKAKAKSKPTNSIMQLIEKHKRPEQTQNINKRAKK